MSTFARTARVSRNNSQPNFSAITINRDAVVVKKPASGALSNSSSGTTTPKESAMKGKDGVKAVIKEVVKKEERARCCDEAEGMAKGKKERCGCVEMEELEK